MKAFNNLHFGKMIDFFFEFIPQIILILVLFGWMDLLIILKWLHTVNIDDPTQNDIRATDPSIITTMINMFLTPGTTPKYPGNILFDSQIDVAVVRLSNAIYKPCSKL